MAFTKALRIWLSIIHNHSSTVHEGATLARAL
jgi:hypothetical protein